MRNDQSPVPLSTNTNMNAKKEVVIQNADLAYPREAFNLETGKLWWELSEADHISGTWGALPRMASWLRWNVEIGERFSTQQLRSALGVGQEHFQRRQRELRDLGWRYLSSKEEPSLGEDCVLEEYGWWPGIGPRPKKEAISSKLRRQVFARDGARCVLCGRAAGEQYEDGAFVTLTAGHIIPASHGGRAVLENLRTECRLCNESSGADTGSVLDSQAVLERVRTLKKADRLELLHWIATGQRVRSDLDRAFDMVRLGGPHVRDVVVKYLENVARR